MSRSIRTAYLAAVASAGILLAGCGTDTGGDPADSPTQTEPATQPAEEPTVTDDTSPTPIPVPTPTDDADALPTGPVDPSVLERDEVKAAIAAEAERRDVSEDEVEVIGFAEVTWSDGSLGCPQPGMHYTQALVDGEQLILEVDGERASYHAGRDGAFNYCADPMAPAPGGSGGARPTM